MLAIYSSAISLIVYLGVVLAVIKLRKLMPDHTQSFRIPGGYTVPVAATIAILWFLSHLSIQEAIGIAMLVAGLTAVFVVMQRARSRAEMELEESPAINEFK